MKSKRISRLLSIVLVVALLVQMLPVQAFATQNGNTEPSEQLESAASVTVVGEEITLRGEGEKHFRLSDGSYLAVTYGTPVHYMDNSGNWQDIDNRPVMTVNSDGAASYQIVNADKSTSFASVLSDGTIFSTSVGEFAVSMQLLDTAQAVEHYRTSHTATHAIETLSISASTEDYQVFSRTAVAELEEDIELYTTDEEQNGWKTSDLMPANLTSSIVYEDVFQGVDLRYEASGYNIKEEIIIRETQNTYRYDFLLELTGLTPLLNENGSIDLVDSNNISIYQIPAPFMVDAMGTISTDVEYSLLEVPGGAVLTVTASEEWINTEERVFPISIDPTLNLTIYTSNYGENLNMYVAFVEESVPNTNHAGATPIYVGYGLIDLEMRGYFYVNNLPTLPVGAVVTRASLDLYQTGFSGANVAKLPIGLYEVTSGPTKENQGYPDWIRSLTWNTKPTHDESHAIDYEVVSESSIYFKNNHGPVSWDLTELVKKWYCEDIENRTFALSITAEDRTSGVRAWFAFSAYGSNNSPALIVNYRNNVGIEPYYTYTTLGAGAAGAAYIADATGQLKVTKQVLSYASNVNPFSLNLVYNSDYFQNNATTNYQPLEKMGLSMKISDGWTLDCVQMIEPENIPNAECLKYYDGDGTIHYFLKNYSISGTYYYDEDGLGLKIKQTGNNSYEMSDDHGNVWKFTNKLLTESIDENGNKIIINYADGKLVSIVQKNKNSDSEYTGITVATFGYSGDGRLITICDAAGNVFSLCYEGNQLEKIQHGEEIIAQYGYTGNRVTKMIDTESCYALEFQYTDADDQKNHGRITMFQEQILDLTDTTYPCVTTGATVAVDYPSYSQTVYRDYGKNRVADTGDEDNDDILTYYLFDYAGRTVNAYATDSSDKILGASNAVYSGSGTTEKTNNRTLRTASIGIAGQQLLKNSSFEKTDNLPSGITLVEDQTEHKYARTGVKALPLSQTATIDEIQLPGGQAYTFSAYVDTSAATGFSGQGIYLKVSDGEKAWEGIPINYKTSADNRWARISVTFTAPSDDAYTFSICNDGVSGAVYVDDLQLEEGEAPSNYNLMENGSLSLGNYGWDWGTGASYAEITEENTIHRVIRITGSPNNAAANASQTVKINLPSTETYVLSGWVTANAVPDTVNKHSNPAQDTNKQCGLRAAIHYTDESVEYHYVPFNTDLSTKQFVSYTIVPNPKDANGNPVVKTVSHIVITCAYETNANVALFDDISLVREVTQTMEYDKDGNLKSVTTSGLDVDINTYNGGNLIKTVTGSQGVFQYTYDNTYKHRLTSVTNRASEDSQTEYITQSMTYDDVGNVVSTVLTGPGALSMSTHAQYGNTGNEDSADDYAGNLLTSVTDATGATVTYQYGDAKSVMWGLPTMVKAPNNTETHTAYDLFGRVTQTSVAGLATLMYNYEKGNLKEISRTYKKVDAETNQEIEINQKYNLAYDSFGNTTSISVGNNELATYHYATGNGQLEVQEYENGHYVIFEYDNLGRTKIVTYTNIDPKPDTVETVSTNPVAPYTCTLRYSYTGDGQLHSITETQNGVSTVYLYRYDSLGNLVSSEKLINNSLVLRTHHSYDTDNRLSAQGWQIGTDSFSQTYSYGEWDGNLSSIVLSRNDSNTTFTYSYDGLRRLSTVSNGVFTSEYSYCDDDESSTASPRLKSIVHTGVNYSGKTVECNYSYEYDVNGNITKVYYGNRSNTYEYDANNQLIRENNDRRQYTQTWTYDAFGNITETSKYAYTTGNELGDPTSTVTYGYTDSAWGDLLTEYNGQTIAYDAIGNPLTVTNAQNQVVKSYTWEKGRQLKTLTNSKGTWTYTYDADGMRTGRTNGTTTYEYIYAGDKLVRMVKDGEIVDFGYAGGQLATMTYDGVTYYYVLNGQGDVLALVDSSGTMVIGYYYSAYGCPVALKSNSAVYNDLKYLNPFMYRGYVYDIETGFYYVSSRYYDPEIGRFINADDVDYLGAGSNLTSYNLFAYCGNNPVMGYDPTGHWDWGGVIAGLGIIAGTVITVATFGIGSPIGAIIAGAAITTGAVTTYAAATDSTMVVDLSYSKQVLPNYYVKGGGSVVIDFKDDNANFYPHIGFGKGYSDGLSYSVGMVDNYEHPDDYAKHFIDINVGYNAGFDHCWNPLEKHDSATQATAVTFSSGGSYGVGYDYYFGPKQILAW